MKQKSELVKLGELIDIKHGYGFKGEYFTEKPTRNILLTPGNFRIGGGFTDNKKKYYDGPVNDEFVLKPNDLIITMTDLSKNGDTLGFPAMVPFSKNNELYLHNQRLGKVIIKNKEKILKGYLYYLLTTKKYQQSIVSGATGTTVKHTSPTRILEFEFLLPTLETQQKIADILSSLDDKIELNHQMNQTLESMARAIFKSWFVDFDPVYAKTEAHDNNFSPEILDLFPDELVDSELGQIPKGWRVGSISEIGKDIRDTVDPIILNDDNKYIGLEHMPRKSIALSNWETIGNVISNKSRFSKSDILFGKLRPYFHKVGIAPVDGFCSTDIIVINSKKNCQFSYLLFLISSSKFISFVSNASTGTKMPRTSWKVMEKHRILIPNNDVLEIFENSINPLLEKIINNIHLSTHILALRDVLLPSLMKGEV